MEQLSWDLNHDLEGYLKILRDHCLINIHKMKISDMPWAYQKVMRQICLGAVSLYGGHVKGAFSDLPRSLEHLDIKGSPVNHRHPADGDVANLPRSLTGTKQSGAILQICLGPWSLQKSWATKTMSFMAFRSKARLQTYPVASRTHISRLLTSWATSPNCPGASHMQNFLNAASRSQAG